MPTASTTAAQISDIASAWITAAFDYIVTLMTEPVFIGVLIAIVTLYFGINLVRRKTGV